MDKAILKQKIISELE